MNAMTSVEAARAASANDIGLPGWEDISGGWLAHLRAKHAGDRTSLEYAVAERLFAAHNRSQGHGWPFRFGFMAPDERRGWLQRARRVIARDGAVA